MSEGFQTNMPPSGYDQVRADPNNFNQPLLNGPPQGQYNPQAQQGVPMMTNYTNPTYNNPNYNPTYNPTYNPNQPNYNQGYMPPANNNNVIVVNNTTPAQTTPAVIVVNNDDSGYPRLDKVMALIILIVNVFAPGIGTIIMGCVGNKAEGFICIGVCQLLLAIFIIGWIWSIITGLMCLKYSK